MFKGVGKISEHQQKLFYDDTVPGSALPYRRTPFHLRKELEKEIQRQIDEDIIKEAEGPTTWVSPVVVTQRKSGAIHLLCGHAFGQQSHKKGTISNANP